MTITRRYHFSPSGIPRRPRRSSALHKTKNADPDALIARTLHPIQNQISPAPLRGLMNFNRLDGTNFFRFFNLRESAQSVDTFFSYRMGFNFEIRKKSALPCFVVNAYLSPRC